MHGFNMRTRPHAPVEQEDMEKNNVSRGESSAENDATSEEKNDAELQQNCNKKVIAMRNGHMAS